MGSLAALDVNYFAHAFGTNSKDIPSGVKELIRKMDFRYEKLGDPERDKMMQEIEKTIESNGFSRVGESRKMIWEQRWNENLLELESHNYPLESLVPNFIIRHPIVRLNQEYVRTFDSNFEFNFFNVFRLWLFGKYLAGVDAVYEFGCGTGFNLVALAKLYPQKRLYGLDWSASSVELVNRVGKVYGFNMNGRLFDFFSIDSTVDFEHPSAVLTMCALEQVGGDFENFVSFLLEKSPAVCVHMEPLVELYDGKNSVDLLAAKYHRKRGYLEGFLGHLKQLESERRIRIKQIRRLYFGSLYHEGYSYVIWEPLSRGRST